MRFQIHTHGHEHDGVVHQHIHLHSSGASQAEDAPAAAHTNEHRHRHVAFLAGVLHGTAGASHFLVVLPLLAIKGWGVSLLYLACFVVGTVAAMALFAALIGAGSARFGAHNERALKGVMYTAAGLTIAIGAYWLAAPSFGLPLP